MSTAPLGRLLLVPNTLDLGAENVALQSVLPDRVMQQAAALRHWACENARSTRAFLKRLAALHPLALPLQEIQIAELPRPRKGSGETVTRSQWLELLAPALQGRDVGLLSEAGLPAVADPGAELVAVAHAAGVAVQPLAGSSALLLALAASGLNGQSFAFVGYLPQDSAARTQRLRALESASRQHQQTQICIETPYRNSALLAAMLQTLAPSTRLSVSLGLSLAEEQNHSASVADWRNSGWQLSDRLPAVFLWLAV